MLIEVSHTIRSSARTLLVRLLFHPPFVPLHKCLSSRRRDSTCPLLYSNFPQRPSKITVSAFTLSPSRSLAVISFICPLSQLPSKAWGSKRGGEIVCLTSICSVVSFREMTCNLGGKGQLFLSLLFRRPIYRPEALLPLQPSKLQTISGWSHCCGFTHVDRG